MVVTDIQHFMMHGVTMKFGQKHVSASHVAIFRLVRTRTEI